MKLLVLDNYDSFTYNLVHLIRELGVKEIDVYRNDQITMQQASGYDAVILSPGPGLPCEAGIMPELVKKLASTKKILGVCLGHQCLAESFGGTLLNIPKPMHGKASHLRIIIGTDPIYTGVNDGFLAGRYHSWVAERSTLPDCFSITAETEDGYIMSIRHKEYDLVGVQYHPESILTDSGRLILQNWLRS